MKVFRFIIFVGYLLLSIGLSIKTHETWALVTDRAAAIFYVLVIMALSFVYWNVDAWLYEVQGDLEDENGG